MIFIWQQIFFVYLYFKMPFLPRPTRLGSDHIADVTELLATFCIDIDMLPIASINNPEGYSSCILYFLIFHLYQW